MSRSPAERIAQTDRDDTSQINPPLGTPEKPATIFGMKLLIRLDELCKALSVSRSTVWRWQQDRGFPLPKSRGLFSVRDIEEWVATQPPFRTRRKPGED